MLAPRHLVVVTPHPLQWVRPGLELAGVPYAVVNDAEAASRSIRQRKVSLIPINSLDNEEGRKALTRRLSDILAASRKREAYSDTPPIIVVFDANDRWRLREQVRECLTNARHKAKAPAEGPRLLKRIDDVWDYATSCRFACELPSSVATFAEVRTATSQLTSHQVLFSVEAQAESGTVLRFGGAYVNYLRRLHHLIQAGTPLDRASAQLGIKPSAFAMSANAAGFMIPVLNPNVSLIRAEQYVHFREANFHLAVCQYNAGPLRESRLVVQLSPAGS